MHEVRFYVITSKTNVIAILRFHSNRVLTNKQFDSSLFPGLIRNWQTNGHYSCARFYMIARRRLYIHANTHADIHTYTHTQIGRERERDASIHTHTHIYTQTHTYIHTYIHTLTHTHTHKHTRVIYIYIYIYIYITYTFTYFVWIHQRRWSLLNPVMWRVDMNYMVPSWLSFLYFIDYI